MSISDKLTSRLYWHNRPYQRSLAVVAIAIVAALTQGMSANAAPVVTTFNPATDGFKFANTFVTHVNAGVPITTNGLCGGMVYAALDYYNNHLTIPPQTSLPPAGPGGDRLWRYILQRQLESLARNVDKWAELEATDWFGLRNDEFFNWGLEGKPGGRIDELRRQIDAGHPVPLGLRSCGSSCAPDHQVLAFGYDMGSYHGDLGAHESDFKIFVYDPNHPNEKRTLVPDLSAKRWRYRENPHENWLAYFVDLKYFVKQPPPTIGAAVAPLTQGQESTRHVIVKSNGKGVVVVRSPPKHVVVKSNGKGVVVVRSPPTKNVETSHNRPPVVVRTWLDVSGRPLMRFTSRRHDLIEPVKKQNIRRKIKALDLMIWTGRDNLRGGSYPGENCNVVVFWTNGPPTKLTNVNRGRPLRNFTKYDVHIPPSGHRGGEIARIVLHTNFRNGIGGDNWNVQRLRLRATLQ